MNILICVSDGWGRVLRHTSRAIVARVTLPTKSDVVERLLQCRNRSALEEGRQFSCDGSVRK